jgi:hypothetical protein
LVLISNLKKNDFIVDLGSNDGNLLSHFKDFSKVLGVTPEEIGKIAIKRGIPTILKYFDENVSKFIVKKHGKAKIVTATNVFAHIDNINQILKYIIKTLTNDGIFISESHYLLPLIKDLQYDTIYHEHLRYYNANFLNKLFGDFGYEIIMVKKIPTHGGSIRVWASRIGKNKVDLNVEHFLASEKKSNFFGLEAHYEFTKKVSKWRHQFRKLIAEIRDNHKSIYAIGAPSRASTLLSFSGLEVSDLFAVGEISGSHKIGRYMPGTKIPIISEDEVLSKKPDYLLMLSWHIADELIPKIKNKGFEGQFIVPLPDIKLL